MHGGAIYNASSLEINNCTLENNVATGFGGGAIFNVGFVNVTNSTVSANHAPVGNGGAIFNEPFSYQPVDFPNLNISNSTFSANDAAGNGGAINNNGKILISTSTFTRNSAASGGGIYNYPPANGTISIDNSIVAGNSVTNNIAANGPDCSGTIGSPYGHNLIQNTSGATITGDAPGNITGQPANLGPLRNNGGPTRTHALLEGSPAIDAGNGGQGTDQRGYGRVGPSDIGAFEFEGTPPPSYLYFGAQQYSIAENGGSIAITIKRGGNLTVPVTVDYAVTGSAKRPDDYDLSDGPLSFAAYEVKKSFTITIADDALDEPNETVNLNLTVASPGGLIVYPAKTTLTIKDNDLPPIVSISDVTVTEGNGGTTTPTLARFTIRLSAPSGKKVTVQYRTANGTAVAPDDYTAIPATSTDPLPVCSFLPGRLTKIVTVPVKGDTIDEVNESFQVNLSSPTNATMKAINGTLTDRQGIGTITDDDGTSATGGSTPAG